MELYMAGHRSRTLKRGNAVLTSQVGKVYEAEVGGARRKIGSGLRLVISLEERLHVIQIGGPYGEGGAVEEAEEKVSAVLKVTRNIVTENEIEIEDAGRSEFLCERLTSSVNGYGWFPAHD